MDASVNVGMSVDRNNGRTYCTDFARIYVHFRALFCLHLPNEFFDQLVSHLNYWEFMVGATGIEPVTPPV